MGKFAVNATPAPINSLGRGTFPPLLCESPENIAGP